MPFTPFAPAVPAAAVIAPGSWNAGWLAAKNRARAGTGTAKIAVIGDSWAAGASSGTVTDALLFGWCGRLQAQLAPVLGAYAEGYTIGGCNPGGANMNAPSSPYGNVAIPNTQTPNDGGIGVCWGPSVNLASWLTITIPVHPVTGASPTSMDLLTVDFNTNAWQYVLDGGSAVIITPASGSPPTGVNGTVGAGIMRRTSFALPGNAPHTVVLQQNAGNALAYSGHIVYYGTTGLGIMRAAVPGSKSIDFCTGGGATAGNSGGNGLTPDHIIPWSGLSPASTPASNNVSAALAAGFPFSGVDLAIIQLGGNDCTQGSSDAAMRKALVRFVNALRRANPVTSTSAGVSIMMLGEAYVSEYSDNASGAPATNFEWQRYKTVAADVAQDYGCCWLDTQQVFGETPVTRGLMVAGAAHPTQNGLGAGGGDGHLTIANAVLAQI